MRVELSRFRVKDGKSARVDEWLEMLNLNMKECITALDREEMKLEVIFREKIGSEEFLYWFSVQGEHGGRLEDSPFEVDRKHMAFGEECLDHDYGRRDAQPQAVFVPEIVSRAMQWLNPTTAAVPFQPRELIYKRDSETGRAILIDTH